MEGNWPVIIVAGCFLVIYVIIDIIKEVKPFRKKGN